MKRKSVAIIAALTLIVLLSVPALANWAETFGGGKFDLPTWKFYCYPDVTKTYTQTIKAGPNDNHYLSLDETTKFDSGAKSYGSAFGTGFGSPEVFTDVRVGAVVNVTGNASRNLYALAGRTSYLIDNGSISGAPGIVASCYVLLINWENGPANLIIETQKVVQLGNIMRTDYEVAVPRIARAGSYYAELDIVGSGPVYVTGSLYEYKGGPLVARVPTLIDTNGNDPWEDEGKQDAVFLKGVSGICGFNENPTPPGYTTTFDDVFSVSDGPAAVNPSPADGAQGVSTQADLSWTEAAFATSRQLWFGKKGAMQQVTPAPSGKTYDPGILEYGQTYQWRVDQVGPSGVVTGHVWTFTTGQCSGVDDFETYTSDAQIAAASAWVHNIPGGFNYIFLETQRISQGAKSMRFEYQNQYEPYFTNAARTFDQPQDWTAYGVRSLSLVFRGIRDNVEQPMYLILEDASGKSAKVPNPYTYACQSEVWRQWDVDLAEFSKAGVDLTKVKKLAIGLGSTTASAQPVDDRDTIYIDNIQLCPLRCSNLTGLDLRGDVNGDCAVNFVDLAVMAAGWLNNGSSVLP